VPYTADFTGGLPADQLVLALAGMQQDIVTDPTGSNVLFNQLGGHAAVQAVIDQFLVNVAADSRINARFATTDIARLNGLLVEQVCEATGGYCVYSGLDMVTAHTGMGITHEEFGYMVEDLLAAFDTLGVAYTTGTFDGGLPADQLVLALAAMETDIVGL
ncbi:MAG TPA: group 1 truncated hemoglobin, partial [Myxococcota bacterium]|nr:group 1 truncated hemoglobin [Myxococcota bacterium]